VLKINDVLKVCRKRSPPDVRLRGSIFERLRTGKVHSRLPLRSIMSDLLWKYFVYPKDLSEEYFEAFLTTLLYLRPLEGAGCWLDVG
jgi:hypothetical protein